MNIPEIPKSPPRLTLLKREGKWFARRSDTSGIPAVLTDNRLACNFTADVRRAAA